MISKSLYLKICAPLITVFGLVVVAILVYVPKITMESAVDSAIVTAISTVRQYKVIRKYYTNNVVKKVLAGSNMKPHSEHKGDATKIPLPATFIHDLSAEFTEQGIMNLKLYSELPFPNRSDRKLDQFGKEAWNTLKQDPGKVFSRMEKINGEEVMRVAIADTMSAEGCVNCHNSHPDTPKTDWKLGDLRGVLEVQVPIDGLLAIGSSVSSKISGLVIVTLLFSLALLMGLFRRLVSARLKEVTVALREIADGDGDLSQRLPVGSDDEIGKITRMFNHFVGQLEISLQQIGTEVRQLVSTADGLKSIADHSQEGVVHQQQEIENVSAAMEEMTSSAREVASLAVNTTSQAENTETETKNGRSVVLENVHSVENLSEEIGRASDAVSSLATDSQNIGGVLDVIRDIADQTNLLALNAAIEAARAGEQGRGFAVVADEVRTLASRTQASTEEIQEMISELQAGAKKAVNSIERGNESIQASLDQAGRTNEVIATIADSISNIRDLNTQIATSAEEQTATSEEMDGNLRSIANISRNSTESSENLISSADEISQVVGKINNQLSRFTGG